MNYDDKKEDLEVKEKQSPWMLTYGDMVTLLLVFFVFIFAFSTIDVQKFREIVISLRGALGNLRGDPRVILPSDLPRPNPESGQPIAIKSLVQAIPSPPGPPGDESFENKGVKSKKGDIARVSLTQQGRVVRIPDIVMFDRGKTEIKPEFEEFLRKLYALIGYYSDNQITIIGRPDRAPLKSDKYPHDDWELASARALAVLNFYTDELKVSPERFTVMAYGEYSEDQKMIEIIFRPKQKID